MTSEALKQENNKIKSNIIKTFKFSLVLRTHENTVFITLDDKIYGVHY